MVLPHGERSPSMARTSPPRIPSYRLHKASGLAVVRLNGRDVYLGRHGTPESRERYERAIAEWLERGRRLPRRQAGHRQVVGEGSVGVAFDVFDDPLDEAPIFCGGEERIEHAIHSVLTAFEVRLLDRAV